MLQALDPFPWDINHDGIVNVNDLVGISGRWGWTGPPGAIPEDVNGDGFINVNDMVAIGGHFLQFRPGSSTPIATPPSASHVSVSLVPPSLVLNAGDTATVSVRISTDQVTRGMQLGLSFDPTIVQVQSVAEGNFYSDWANPNGALSNVILPWVPNNTTGTVSTGVLIILGGPPTDGPTGSGVVAAVSLRAIRSGTTPLRLTNVVLSGLSSTGAPQDITPLTILDGQVDVGAATQTPAPGPTGSPAVATATVIPTPGNLSPTPIPTPTPTQTLAGSTPTPSQTPVGSAGSIGLRPDPSIVAPIQVGDTFKYNVELALNPGLESRGIQLGLSFDPAVIQVTRVDLGPYYSDWALAHGGSAAVFPRFVADNVHGSVSVGSIIVQTSGSQFQFAGVGGSGIVAVVTMKAVGGSPQTALVPTQAMVSVIQPGLAAPVLDALTVTQGLVQVGTTLTPTPALPTATLTSPALSPAPTGTPPPTIGVATRLPTLPPVVSTVTSLSISPSSVGVAAGATMTVDVVVATDQVTRGVQFGMSFDPNVVSVTSVVEGTFYSDWANTNGAQTNNFVPWIANNTSGIVSTGVLIIAGGPPTGGPTGSGTVATITLQAANGLASGSSPLTLTNVAISGLDQAGNPGTIGGTVIHSGQVSVGIPTATPAPGTPTATPTSTPFPTITAGPTGSATPTDTSTPTATPLPTKGTLSFDPPSTSVGLNANATFTVNVKATLNADVRSRGIQFGLTFDSTKVNITRVDLGPLYKDWASSHGAAAQITSPFKVDNAKGTTAIGAITVTNQTQGGGTSQFDGASGTGVVAVITFKTVGQGSAALGFTAPQLSFIIPGVNNPGLGALGPTSGAIVVGSATTVTPTITPTGTTTATLTPTETMTATPTATGTPTLGATPLTGTANLQATVAPNSPTLGPITSTNTTLSMSPATKNVQIGDTFTLDVVLNVDRASRGAQFSMTFDKSVVQVDSVDEGTFYKNWAAVNSSDTTVLPQWTPDNTTGKVSIGAVLLSTTGANSGGVSGAAASGPSGTGTIATVSLKALANGTATLALNDVVINGVEDRHGAADSTNIDAFGKAKEIQGTVVKNGQIVVGLASGTITPTSPTPMATTTLAQAAATQAAGGSAATTTGGSTGLVSSAAGGFPGNAAATGASTGSGISNGVSGANTGDGTTNSAGAPGANGAAAPARAAAGPAAANAPRSAASSSNVPGQPGSPVQAADGSTNPAAAATSAAVQVAGVVSANPGGPAAGGSGGRTQAGGGNTQRPVAGLVASIDISAAIDERGIIQREVLYTDPGGAFTLLIPSNTIALDRDHKPLRAIQVELLDDHPVVPDDRALVGQALEFNPSGASFNPPIRITLGYDAADLPDGFTSANLDLAFFDGTAAQWTTLGGTAEPSTRSVTATASHFTSFGVLTRPGPSVNWTLTAGILALELGLGLGAFVLIRRRRRLLAAAGLEADAELFAASEPPGPHVVITGSLPAPTAADRVGPSPGAEGPVFPLRKVEEDAKDS